MARLTKSGAIAQKPGRKVGSGARKTSEYYRLRDRQKKRLQALKRSGAITQEEYEAMMLPTEATATRSGAAMKSASVAWDEMDAALLAVSKGVPGAKERLLRESYKQQTRVAQPIIARSIRKTPKGISAKATPLIPSTSEAALEEAATKIEPGKLVGKIKERKTGYTSKDPLEAGYPRYRDDIKRALAKTGIAGLSEEELKELYDFIENAPIRDLLLTFSSEGSYVGMIYSETGEASWEERKKYAAKTGYRAIDGRDIMYDIKSLSAAVIDGKSHSYDEIKKAYAEYKHRPAYQINEAASAKTEEGLHGIPRWIARLVKAPRTYGMGKYWEE